MTVKILMCGDSVQASMTSGPGGNMVVAEHTIPGTLQTLLGPGYTCVNAGIGGSSAPDQINGTAGCTAFATLLAASDANHVVMHTAINDAYRPNYTVQNYLDCFTAMRTTAWGAGKGFFISLPNPINMPHNDRLWDFQHALKAHGAYLSVPVVDHYGAIVAAVPNWPAMLPDAVHPNAELYRFMGQTAFMTLAPHVRVYS